VICQVLSDLPNQVLAKVPPVEEDRVGRLVADFKRLRPDIDPKNKAVAARLLHLSDLVQRYYGAVGEHFDLSLSGLGVLTALARSAPRKLTLAELNRDILVTSGGITFLVARLGQQGLVTKRPHPSDGRAVLVQLTPRGRRVAGQLIDAIALADAVALAHLNVGDLCAADEVLVRLQAGIESAMSARETGINR
jgi:DNA-binding MarR family transcriptional regulator